MVESTTIVAPSSSSSSLSMATSRTASPSSSSFATSHTTATNHHHHRNEDTELLEMRIAETRAQLQALREEGCRQRLAHAQQQQTLQSQFDHLQHTLTKSSSRLNMFAYTHAMLQAQTNVVQPYILKKQALLCHAFHHNEVLTKQIHLRQLHADGLVTVLEQANAQIVEFWQARLSQLQRNVHQVRDEVKMWRDRMLLLPNTSSILSTLRSSSPTTTLSSSSWLRSNEVIIEEEEDEEENEEYDDEDDNMSSSTSSSSQWTEEASPPPPPHHQHDAILHVLSMALTAVAEGRLPSVFDLKPVHTRSHSNTSFPPPSPQTSTSGAATIPTTPKQLDEDWEEKSSLRRSLVGLETF